MLRFTLGAGGKPQDVTVVRQTNRIFGEAATQVVANDVRCEGPVGQVVVTPPIVYKTE